jgi:hypothetical protein
MTTIPFKFRNRAHAECVEKWLNQNVDEEFWDSVNWSGDVQIFFVHEQDAMMFSLKFL